MCVTFKTNPQVLRYNLSDLELNSLLEKYNMICHLRRNLEGFGRIKTLHSNKISQ